MYCLMNIRVSFVRRKVVKQDDTRGKCYVPREWIGHEVIVMLVSDFEKLISYVQELEHKVQFLEKEYFELKKLFEKGIEQYITCVLGGKIGLEKIGVLKVSKHG